MNFKCETEKIGFRETVFETTSEQSVEADINLPDYCPEIQRILKCNVSTNVISLQNNSGRVTADVNAVIRLIYIGENGKTASFEQVYPIQKFVESNKITPESAVCLNICNDYVNCRAVNSRRADIKAMLTFVFRAVNKRYDDVLCSAEGAGIQLMKEDYSVASVSGICIKTFSMNEVVEIPDHKNDLAQIINISSHVMVNDTKIISNKALIKGDCIVKIYYLAENNDIDCIEHSMPVSQVIELDGLNENNICHIRLNVCSFEAVPKSDSSGNMRLVELNARINAFVTALDEIPVSLISDAYSTDYEVNNTYKNTEICEYNDKINTAFTNKVVLESIGVTVDAVFAVWCSDLKYSFSPKDKGMLISGTYQANVLYRDSDGKTDIIQKFVDFEYLSSVNNKAEYISCLASAQITACNCSITGDSRLEMKTEIYISGIVFSRYSKKHIASLSLDENALKNNKKCALTICFCNDGDDVWNIARKYNTTVDAVMIENELTERIIRKGRMMLIPGI